MFKEVHLNVKLLRMLENAFVKQLYGRQVLITFDDHFDMLNAFALPLSYHTALPLPL